MSEVSGFRKAVVLGIFAVIGWAYCGALVAIGRRFLSMDATLVVHAVGAPIGFGLLTLLYRRWFAYTGPLRTAIVFLGIVVGLDLALVAPVFERSFAMFASPLGTWIPFALIFLAVWGTGEAMRRRHSDRRPSA